MPYGKYRGLIVIGYQGIGKTSYAGQDSRCIDLESSSFKINGFRHEDWYITYCKLAINLAKQGYVVFTSSHRIVVERFARFYQNESGVNIVIVAPNQSLKEKWTKRLYDRYLKDPIDKNQTAWKDAEKNYESEIDWLIYESGLPIILLDRTDYLIDNVIQGLCQVYGTHRIVNG